MQHNSKANLFTDSDFDREIIPIPQQVSWGRAFFEHPEVQKQRSNGSTARVAVTFPHECGITRSVNDYQARATLTSSGLTSIDKLPTVTELGQQRLTVSDICGQGTTDQATVRYIRESSFTNAATSVAEGGTKPEASFAIGEVDAPVRKIAVTSTITDEMMQDQRAVISYVDNRLRFSVQTTEELQLLRGDGTGSNLLGIQNVPGVLAQAKGADNQADAIFKGATKVHTQSFLPATAVVIHPQDWQTLRLLKDANGQMYGGGPMAGPYGNGPFIMADKLWGMNAIVTTNQTQGTAIVGNFAQGCMIFRRAGITLEASNSDGSNFILNLVTLRVEERLAFACFIPLAFCLVTGL